MELIAKNRPMCTCKFKMYFLDNIAKQRAKVGFFLWSYCLEESEESQGDWGAQLIKHLSLTQVMISRSWDKAPH